LDEAEAVAVSRKLAGHRSIANTVVYTAVADKRIRNIWAK
jgi:site-specific recombinase XerD